MPNFSHHGKSYNGCGSIFNDCVVKRISRISLPCIVGLNGVGAVEAEGGAVRARCVDGLARVLGVVFLVCFSFSSFAQTVNITVFRHYSTNKILWGGDGNLAWDTLQLERRGAFLYSYSLETSGLLGGLDINISPTDSLQNVYDRLATNPVEDFKYVDWGGDWSGNITPYFPSGHVFRDDDTGLPTGVVMNQGGEMSTVPLESQGAGFVSAPVVNNGVTGQWYVTDTDGMAFSQFIPSWSGGVTDDSEPTTQIDPFYPNASFKPPASAGGGGDSGGGGTSGGGGGGGTVENNYFTYNTVETTSVEQDGTTYDVVSIPRYDVPIYGAPSGGGTSGGGTSGGGTSGGGTSGGGTQATIPVFDYSGILNSIGGTLQAHAIQNNKDLGVINENITKLLEIQDDGNLQVAPTDDSEYTVDFSESDQALQDVSGWGFDFGFDQNPLGDVFTAIIGNPPTSFGSSDQVWDINFKIARDIEVRSTFKLSDWFPRVFRSCILMMATIVFSISSAKTIGEAFS